MLHEGIVSRTLYRVTRIPPPPEEHEAALRSIALLLERLVSRAAPAPHEAGAPTSGRRRRR
jgi:hypothetical protein